MYQDAPAPRWYRLLTWSFPIGKTFGIQVRLFWTAGIFLLYAFLQLGDVGARFAEAATLAGMWFVGLYLVVWTHEMGHALAARRWNVRTSQISLSVFGGLAHLQDGLPSPRAETVVSLAGPAVHLVWLAILWPLSLRYDSIWAAPGSDWMFDTAGYAIWFLKTTNVWLAIFNLLPFFPMDGGRVLRSILARRMHPNLATLWAARVGIVGAVGIAAWGLVLGGLGGSITVLIAVNNVLACLREMTAARYTDGPYGAPRAAWEGDPDAWKVGLADEPRPVRKRGRLRLLGRASPRPPDILVSTKPADDADLDRLLEKVGRVGLSGLTDLERATLQRISEARRRSP